MPKKTRSSKPELMSDGDRHKDMEDFKKETRGTQGRSVDAPKVDPAKIDSPDDVYVFYSKYEFSAGVKTPSGKFNALFNNCMYVVNSTRSAKLGIPMSEMVEGLQKQGNYGYEFVLFSGPGYKPTPEVEEFVKVAREHATMRGVAMVSGPRTTGTGGSGGTA